MGIAKQVANATPFAWPSLHVLRAWSWKIYSFFSSILFLSNFPFTCHLPAWHLHLIFLRIKLSRLNFHIVICNYVVRSIFSAPSLCQSLALNAIYFLRCVFLLSARNFWCGASFWWSHKSHVCVWHQLREFSFFVLLFWCRCFVVVQQSQCTCTTVKIACCKTPELFIVCIP